MQNTRLVRRYKLVWLTSSLFMILVAVVAYNVIQAQEELLQVLPENSLTLVEEPKEVREEQSSGSIQPPPSLEVNPDAIYSQLLTLSDDGTRIATITEMGGIDVLETLSNEIVAYRDAIPPPENSYYTSVLFDHTGDKLFAGTGDDSLRIWDVPGESLLTKNPRCLSRSPAWHWMMMAKSWLPARIMGTSAAGS